MSSEKNMSLNQSQNTKLEWLQWQLSEKKSILNGISDAIMLLDAKNYTILDVNKAFLHIYKTSREQVLGKTCHATTHHLKNPCHTYFEDESCPLIESASSGNMAYAEHEHKDLNGEKLYFEITAYPLKNVAGEVTRIIHLSRNVTDRKQAEENLRKSEERFRQIAEAAEEWIWEVDTEGLYTYASPVVERMLGWKPSEIIGEKHFYDLFTPDSKEQLKKTAFEKFSQKESFKRFTNVNVHKNGNIVFLETSGLPILDKDENLLGYRGVDTDITDRIKAEEALRKANDNLERRVEERTAELRKSYNEKEIIRDTFGAYLSDEVASEILKSPGDVKLGGEMREMTILVSDLREFSTITETMEASQIVQIINSHHERMIPIIMQHEGTVDEFIGDGILVFFGAPRFLDDHARRAVACALEMQTAIQELNKENPVIGLPQIEMGIGISTGHLVVGSIGTDKRRKYGAIGNPINVAFRLEEKARPGEVLITEGIKAILGNSLQIGSRWNESLKGIGKTQIYRVIGMEEE